MEDKPNYKLVGAFVLVLGAALVAGVLWLAAGIGSKQAFDPYRSVIVESVAGLSIDAPVKYLGVDVGKVSEIGIDPQNSRQVLLRFLIKHGTPVKQDSEAVLKTQGLTGIAYVELSGGSLQSPLLVATPQDPVPLIRSKPSLSARLENVLGTVLTGLDRMSGNLNSVFDEGNRTALKQTLADMAVIVHAVAARKDALGNGIADAARTAHVAAQASSKLEPTLVRITAGAAAVEELAQVAGVATRNASQAVDAAASATTGGVQQLRAETLPDLGRLVGELQHLAVSLRQLSEQTERSPSSLLVGAPKRPLGPGERPAP